MKLNACVVGIGTSDVIGKDPGRSPLRLQFESFCAALRDANLEKTDVNGIVTAWGAPRGVDYDEFVVAAGASSSRGSASSGPTAGGRPRRFSRRLWP